MTLFSRRSFALGFLALCLLAGTTARPVRAASTFDSGSTGADGAFAPTANVTLQVPDSGVFNYTTVNIPSNVTVMFTRNAANTPVTILASGDVTISGYIDVSGSPGSNTVNGTNINIGTFRSTGGAGGPGGFDGGGGGGYVVPFTGVAGDGPGGGTGGFGGDVNNEQGGAGGGYSSAGSDALGIVGGVFPTYAKGGIAYGSSTLLPLIGGSGGGGGGSVSQLPGGSGGGGGGAILIASSGTITVPGYINAQGGNGGSGCNGGGGGSGGAVRLVATTLAGNATVYVNGAGSNGAIRYYNGGSGAPGYVRFEAYNFNSFNPIVVSGQGVATTAGPGPVTLANVPMLQIVSVAGISAPAAPRGSLAAPPDIIVKNTVTNPVDVAIAAHNIPTGTIVTVSLIPQTGAETSVLTAGLAGTAASSTTTASVSLPDGKCVLYASATIDLTTQPHARQPKIAGELVDKILVAAVYGGASTVTYVLHSGRKIVVGGLPVGYKGAKASRN